MNELPEAAAAAAGVTRRLRLTISYDGANFRGWQFQPGEPTVQGTLEDALRTILGEPVRVTGAGRTDAGVHALGQCAHFDTAGRLAAPVILRALGARLPLEIRVRELAEAPTGFHARYSARSKLYRYQLAEPGGPEEPFLRKTHWVRPLALDREALETCARLLTGEHDFFTFSRQEGHRGHHRCTVLRAAWSGTAPLPARLRDRGQPLPARDGADAGRGDAGGGGGAGRGRGLPRRSGCSRPLEAGGPGPAAGVVPGPGRLS